MNNRPTILQPGLRITWKHPGFAVNGFPVIKTLKGTVLRIADGMAIVEEDGSKKPHKIDINCCHPIDQS